jgi:hypothetical protein
METGIVKFIISLLLIALLSFASGLYLPWWSIAIVSFLVSLLIYQKPAIAFISGFIALFILWGCLTWFRSVANDHILANKMSLLILKSQSPGTLIFLTTLIGAIIGGMAAFTGSLIRKLKDVN